MKHLWKTISWCTIIFMSGQRISNDAMAMHVQSILEDFLIKKRQKTGPIFHNQTNFPLHNMHYMHMQSSVMNAISTF